VSRRTSGRAALSPRLVSWATALLALLAATSVRADLHEPWDRLLARYVDDDGQVAYRALQGNDAAMLDAYLASLAAADPNAWSRDEQLAFWLNAYNAIIVKGVLLGQSPESFLGRTRFFRFYAQKVAGEERSPEDIEHGILRARFGEPRIHFALVCASTSCPKLRREAYRADRVDAQLEEQTRDFIGDPRRNQFAANEVRLSMIFRWFAEDFEKAAGSVPAFIRRFRPAEGTPAIDYLDYDWTLNAQPGQRL
jgi:hypothetical protein